MIYKKKHAKYYSIALFSFSTIVYFLSIILTYKDVTYILNPFVAPITLAFSFIIMLLSFKQENFTIQPPKFIVRNKPPDGDDSEPEAHFDFTITAYSGDKDDVNIYIESINIDVSGNLKVYEVKRGDNPLVCELVNGGRNTRKHTFCAVNDRTDVNTKFKLILIPDGLRPDDVNRLEIEITYERHWWKFHARYIETLIVRV